MTSWQCLGKFEKRSLATFSGQIWQVWQVDQRRSEFMKVVHDFLVIGKIDKSQKLSQIFSGLQDENFCERL